MPEGAAPSPSSTPSGSPLDAPYDPKGVEAKAQALWEREKCHAFDPASKAEIFSVDTPPPTVSGSLHIGHVFSYTQAECIARYQRMRGKNVFYPFGFDGNGLPTERLAEQEHGVKGKDMPRPDFVKLCLETSRKYEKEFEGFMRSLGISADWSLAYSTIDDRSIRISQRGFLDLWKKGEAYLKESPTLWCTQCGTALAQADLEFKDKPSAFTTLKFELVGGGSIEIATTRPELLPACAAVFVHPSDAKNKGLAGRRALVPLQGRDVPILADEKVDPEKGTGLVMCCTFGDKTDVEWFQKHRLPLRQAIGPTGQMMAVAGPESGLYANKARKAILERLTAAGHVTGTKEIVHPVATHDRCGTDIQFLSTKQVFVKILDKKADLIAQGEKIRWFPEHMGKRYRNWVENLEWDWCISRQRFYGVPFPFWHCKACGEVTVARDGDLPIDPTVAPPPGPCAKCGQNANSQDGWVAERDVMDTWATSSETPQINARWGDANEIPGLRPMSMRPQAHDIIRTWAFYTILKSWIHHKALPWKDAVISGHVQAPGREKISKSKGNAPESPQALVEKHGADAVRYWALSAKLGSDYVFSAEDLAAGRRLSVKLWNASKLVLSHLKDYERPTLPRADAARGDSVREGAERAVDRGIRLRLAETTADATALLDAYEFGLAKQRVCEFFWGDLCDNWLEMAKDRFYDASPEKAADRRAAQAVAYDVLYGVLRLLAPFVPHVVEVIHQCHFRQSENEASITRTPWPAAGAAQEGEASAAWSLSIECLQGVRRWRSERKVSPGKPIARARVTLPPAAVGLWAAIEGDVRAAGRVETFEAAAGAADLASPVVEVLEPPAA